MVDEDAFLLLLYCMVDDFCKSHLPVEIRPGPDPALNRSEVITLAVYAQWHRFQSEQEFYRYALRHLRGAFPHLPDRTQYNRQLRHHAEAMEAFFVALTELLGTTAATFEVLDTTAVPVRNAKRRGDGWLAGLVDIGWSLRRFWFEGFRLLGSATPEGIVTGYGFGPASSNERSLAEAFFALRATPDQRLWPAAGHTASGDYLADSGFAGVPNRAHWKQAYGASVTAPPQRSTKKERWPADLRRWAVRHRQIVESVFGKLFWAFRLDHERPHDLRGFRARLAATLVLHNFCIWLNRSLGRPSLAFADLVAW